MRLRTGVVDRVVIVKVPDGIETPTRQSAESLERTVSVRLQLEGLSPHIIREKESWPVFTMALRERRPNRR
jgi:hypothetical protein